MKILFITDNFKPEPGAAPAHVHERARIWVEQGHQVTVLCAHPNFPEGRIYPGHANRWRTVEDMDGIRVVRVKTFITANEGFLLRILDFASFMFSSAFFGMFEERPDVILATSPHLLVTVAGVFLARFHRVPHVFELRDLWPASIVAVSAMKPGLGIRMLEKLELWLYRASDRVLSFTYAFADDLESRGIPRSKCDVVINGANLSLFQPRPKDQEIEREFGLAGRFVIGYMGTMGMAHGLENVVEAADRLRDLPITFLFVGAGAGRDAVAARVSELGLTNVVIAPRQLKEDMPRFWSVCDVSLIHLKGAELFTTVIPSKTFESMAMGKPVLFVGPEGEGSRLVLDHRIGFVVPPDDPDALAAAARDLYGAPAKLEAAAVASLAAAPLFSRENQAAETLKVLRRALDGVC